MTTQAKRTSLPLVSLALLAALGALGWYLFRPGGALRGEPVSAVEGVPVKRGNLRISIVERGNLSAADALELRNETEHSTTIISIIEEGVWVEAGDVVCELDVTELVDERFQAEIAVRNAEAAYIKSKQTYEIQKSQNESDIAGAEQALTFAHQDLTKFTEADEPLALAAAEEAILLAEEESERAKENLEWSKKLAERGFLTQTELEADRLALTRATIQLDQDKRALDTQVGFELPKQKAVLEAGLTEAKRELERVKLQASARLADYEADLSTNEATLKLEREKLAKTETQIAAGTITTPRAGMIVYSQEDGGRWGRDDPISKGTEVGSRQGIISIPRAGGMIAEASLHESVLKQVRPGFPCEIKVDALPQRMFRGQVKTVAVLPDQNSWYANPNQRLYKTQIEIKNASEELRPGMSCSIEILVDNIVDALHVPVQAVFRDGGENVCFVTGGPESERGKRTVEVGAYNDRWVEIHAGLREGEVVAMHAPPDFVPRAEAPSPFPEDELDGAEPDLQVPPSGARGLGGIEGQGDSRPTAAGREGGREGGRDGGEREGGREPARADAGAAAPLAEPVAVESAGFESAREAPAGAGGAVGTAAAAEGMAEVPSGGS